MTSTPMPTPSVEYGLLSPIFIVFGVAIVGVLVEAFLPRRFRYGTQVLLALGGLDRRVRRGRHRRQDNSTLRAAAPY